MEGLKEILEKRASLNGGLSKSLKESFPLIVGVKRITVYNNILKDICSEWLAGFSSGESNFYIAIRCNKVWLRFSVAQDSRDLLLLNNIVRFLIVVMYLNIKTEKYANL